MNASVDVLLTALTKQAIEIREILLPRQLKTKALSTVNVCLLCFALEFTVFTVKVKLVDV